MNLKAELVPAGPCARDMELGWTVAASDDSTTVLVAQGTWLGCVARLSNSYRDNGIDATATHRGPAMRGNRADTLNNAQTLGVGECYLRYEHCAREVHPTLTLGRLANAQKRVGWWI